MIFSIFDILIIGVELHRPRFLSKCIHHYKLGFLGVGGDGLPNTYICETRD